MLSAGNWILNQANEILFVLIDSSNSEVSGLGSSFDVYIAKSGGTFSAGVGTKTEIGMGWYSYVSTAGEADTVGPIAIVVEAVGAVQQNLEYIVESRNPNSVEFTYTVTSSVTGLPLERVFVNICSDSAGQDTVWTGYTDNFGVARSASGNKPRLDPGTYFIFCTKVGYDFPAPDEEVVS